MSQLGSTPNEATRTFKRIGDQSNLWGRLRRPDEAAPNVREGMPVPIPRPDAQVVQRGELRRVCPPRFD